MVQMVRKRLLHITLSLHYGGLEKIVFDFSRKLNPKCYKVHVAALDRAGAICDLLKQNGMTVVVLDRKPGKIDLRLLKRLTKLIKHLRIDIVHSHSGCLMYGALAGRFAGVDKIIHTEHGRYLPDSLGTIWEDRIFSRFITKYICVSKDLEEYILSKIRVPRQKLATIVNGIDTSRYYKYGKDEIFRLRQNYNISPDDVVLGTVCRLVSPKNIEFLIHWMKLNRIIHKNLKLIIVGDGPSYKELVMSAESLPTGCVRFLGERGNIPDMMNIFDIFVLPSATEGTSLTILEAMSTQTPAVVSDVGGNRHIISHGETGYLFELNNADSFSNFIQKLALSRQLRQKIGRFARRAIMENFSLEKMVRSYCEQYEG